MAVIHYTAVFPRADRADAFYARITEPGWSAFNVKHIAGRRKVEWDADPVASNGGQEEAYGVPVAWTYFNDMLETVGYYGSDQSRKATLQASAGPGSGRPHSAPMSY